MQQMVENMEGIIIQMIAHRLFTLEKRGRGKSSGCGEEGHYVAQCLNASHKSCWAIAR